MDNLSDNIINDPAFPDIVPCSYYNYDLFNYEFKNVNNKFVVVHQNIRSFSCNGDEFELFLGSLCSNIDIVVLTETWFNKGNIKNITGNKGYHSYREGRRGGGVSVFVRDGLKATLVEDFSFVTPVAEFCSVNVNLSSRNSITIVGLYRPPSVSVESFCDLLRDDILSKLATNQNFLIGGDANINMLSNDISCDTFSNLLFSFYCKPYITLPTRISGKSISAVDHIWSNVSCDVSAGVLTTDITDHFTLFARV